MASIHFYSVILCLIAYHANAVMFYLDPNTQKCLRDQVQAHQLVVMEFEVSDAPGHQIDYVVCILLHYFCGFRSSGGTILTNEIRFCCCNDWFRV